MSFNVASAGGGGGAPGPTPIAADEHTLIHWDFSEAVGPFRNHGTLGAAAATDLTAYDGALPLYSGIYQGKRAVKCITGMSTPATAVGEAVAWTFSGWMHANKAVYGDTSAWLKAYSTSGYTMPYAPVCQRIYGSIIQLISTVGAGVMEMKLLHTLSHDGIVCPGDWIHLAAVSNGTDVKQYINGRLVYTRVGVLDFGAHGPYWVGGEPNAPGSYDGLWVADIRVENVARTAPEMVAAYAAGHP